MIAIHSLLTENELADEFVAAFHARRFAEKFFYWFPLSVRAWLALCSDGAYPAPRSPRGPCPGPRSAAATRPAARQHPWRLRPTRRRAPAARAAATARLAPGGRRDLCRPAHRSRLRQPAQPPLRLGTARRHRHHRAGRRDRVRRPRGHAAPRPAPARQALPHDPRRASRTGRRDARPLRRRAARPQSLL